MSISISPREYEVLQLIADEYNSKEIAGQLFISEHTVLSHRKNLITKLDVRNTAGLVRRGIETGLLKVQFILLFIPLLFFSSLSGQDPHLDVDGSVKIRGRIDISRADDSTTVILGTHAGIGLLPNTTMNNTFVGFNAGSLNIGDGQGGNMAGDNNSFFGSEAGKFNTTGVDNSFFGSDAGRLNSTGGDNSFFGSDAGRNNSTGEDNSFFGRDAGRDNTSGRDNSFFGSDAGRNGYNGSRNTFLGASSGQDFSIFPDSLDRAIAIGHNAKVGCHKCAVIGGTGQDAVRLGVGTTSPETLLHIESSDNNEVLLSDMGNVVSIKMQTRPTLSGLNWNMKAKSEPTGGNSSDAAIIFQYGQDSLFRIKGDGNATLAGTLTENSDRRLKTNIEVLTGVLPQLLQLHGYSYDWMNRSKSYNRQIGLLAQEVSDVFPELIQEDNNGVLSVSYTRFVPLLIEGLREQNERAKWQKENINALLEENGVLNLRLNQLERTVHMLLEQQPAKKSFHK